MIDRLEVICEKCDTLQAKLDEANLRVHTLLMIVEELRLAMKQIAEFRGLFTDD